ncbi:MAG: VWA domain-containing protein [Vicinamibacteria bacterium]|nr:VWA domain-containing protein [Vicinamibacteria bacterium]
MHQRARVVAALIVALAPAAFTAVAPQPPQRFSATAVAVIVDATVRDRAGRPMPCLDASQFEVLEDGVPQQISSFEAVDVPDCEPPPEAGAPAAARPQPLVRVLSTPPLVTALVFEELGEHARVAAWQAARAFVEEGRRPGEFVGVFVVERAVITMVPYTRDTDALLAGLRRAAMRPGCPIYLPPDVASAATPSGCSNGLPGNLRTSSTLKGLQTVAGTLAHLPGRKNIVLFSEGFTVSAQDNSVDIFRHLTSYSNQGAVTFHTIDAAGPRMGRIKGLDQDPTAYLERVALDTGGQHVRATNDITGAVRRLTADMRDYYRLTYSPTNTALDGRFRAITVRVRDPEAVVTARNGYLASPRAATPMVAPYDVAPHVLLDAATLPADFTLSCGATLASSAITVAASVRGDALAFTLPPAGGAFEAGVTLLARVRGKDGRVLAASSETFSLSGSRAQLAAARNRELRFTKALPRAGAETVEVIAYDVLSGKASARRFKVKDLPPALAAVGR